MRSIIEIKNLYFSYKNQHRTQQIVRGLDLNIGAGEFVAIKGPSGHGKSTLLYLVAGLLKPDSGDVIVQGTNLKNLNDLELAQFRNATMGFVFQQFYLLPKLSLADNILLPKHYPLEFCDEDNEGHKSSLHDLAAFLGLEKHLQHFPNQLSGGQQQRVAIARALINSAPIILADEPTGNLDAASTQKVLEYLHLLKNQGKTILLITHDDHVAHQADRVLNFFEGKITQEEVLHADGSRLAPSPIGRQKTKLRRSSWQMMLTLIPMAAKNLLGHKVRTFLTMLGVIIGIAAVIGMITLGNFVKKKILDSYADLGVNSILFRGYPNWRLKASDKTSIFFQEFKWDKDLLPLLDIFPQIRHMSPNLVGWDATTAIYAGKTVEEVMPQGVNEFYSRLALRELKMGQDFNPHNIKNRDHLCIIGSEIFDKIFSPTNPIGKILFLNRSSGTVSCKVIGVYKFKEAKQQWLKPNLGVYFPYTYFQDSIGTNWEREIHEVFIEFRPNTEVARLSKAIEFYFKNKYSNSGIFMGDSDSVLLAQMNRFLGLFTILLTAIALISLSVGGIGIANMMLVSVAERLKEIGIRKSIGASSLSIRLQFLTESFLICLVAGVMGIFLGIVLYEGALYGATFIIPKLQFEWIFDPTAILFSFSCIFVVGILSGLMPALKAEKLQVIEALRNE